MIARWLIYNIKAVASFSKCSFAAIIFLLVCLLYTVNINTTAHALKLSANMFDLLYYVFAGPDNENTSITDLLAWLTPYLIFLLFTIQVIIDDLEQNAALIFLRIRNRLTWWQGKVLGIIILSFLFTLFLFLITFLISFLFYGWDTNWSSLLIEFNLPTTIYERPIIVFIQMYLLLWSSLSLVSCIALLSTLIGLRPIYGYFIIFIIMCISWIISSLTDKLIYGFLEYKVCGQDILLQILP